MTSANMTSWFEIWCHPMTSFDWPDVSYFQAKFGWERVKASKVILNYSKLSRFDKPFGGGLAPLWKFSIKFHSPNGFTYNSNFEISLVLFMLNITTSVTTDILKAIQRFLEKHSKRRYKIFICSGVLGGNLSLLEIKRAWVLFCRTFYVKKFEVLQKLGSSSPPHNFESENFRFPLLTRTQMERFERSLVVSARFSLVTHSVTDSAQIISVRKASLWREYVTWRKCPLSLLIGVRIKRVKFRENVWAFCQDKQNYPLYTHGCPY